MASASQTSLRLDRGDVFGGRFEILERLGQGGMGAVFRAFDRALDETIALKVLLPVARGSADAVQRFRREVKLSRRVTHTNVVRVYDIGEHGDLLFMTMEYISGVTLKDVIKSMPGGLPIAQVLHIGAALADGLGAVHGHGIVHRDVKPSNVMMEAGGRVLLADFGIASPSVKDEAIRGELIGTFRYMAPEQLRGEALGPWTDLYALGLVLLEAWNGYLPDRGERGLLEPNTLVFPERPTLEERRAHEGLAALLAACLQSRPARRISSAREVRDAFDRIAALPGGTLRAAASVSRVPVDGGAPDRAAWPERVGDLGTKGIAVAPFSRMDSTEPTDLGKRLADDLVVVLRQSRGLRVLEWSDAVSANVVALVGGVLEAIGPRTRIDVRVVDPASGKLLWSDTVQAVTRELECSRSDVLLRMAASIFRELTTQAYAAGLPAHVLQDYVEARRGARANDEWHLLAAYEHFDTCVAAAPDFLPAWSGRAFCAVRCWFSDRKGIAGRDWELEACEAVDRAMSLAPELAETHLSAGMYATQRCEFHRAVKSLERAIRLAPLLPEPQEYFGMLLSEGDRLEDGRQHLTLATQLDPERPFAWVQLARRAIFLGDHDRAQALLDNADRVLGAPGFGSTIMRLRSAAFRSGLQESALRHDARAALQQPHWKLPALYASVLEGRSSPELLASAQGEVLSVKLSPRAFTSVGQLLVEMWMLLARDQEALEVLGRIVDAGLVDLVWLSRCPLLVPLWDRPPMEAFRRKTRLQAQAMWM